MSDFLRLTIVVELLGLAALPLSAWFFRGLPDRGYIFSKTLGLLVVGYVTWLAGSIFAVGGSAVLPIVLAVSLGICGWGLVGRPLVTEGRSLWRIIAAEEIIFLATLIGWSLLRAYVLHPDISHTEQYMDMAFFNASSRSTSYPPYDPWMSGHTINYYYFGYLLFGLLVKVAGVVPSVGYNLALSLIAALTASGTFGIGYALSRRIPWALLSTALVAFSGNLYAVLNQIPHGQFPSNTHWWFWQSSRVIGSAADYTINEFPFFSFVLGDLHPHVMSLPFVLLAVGAACAILFDAKVPVSGRAPTDAGRILVLGIVLGCLFTINSWDYPTYGLLIFAAIMAQGYLIDATTSWWRRPLATIVAVGLASLILFVPFYLHFTSLAHGVGLVHTHSDVTQYLQIFGYPLLLCVLLIGSLAALLRPIESDELSEDQSGHSAVPLTRAETGAVELSTVALVGALALLAILGFALNLGALVLPFATGFGALIVLQRVVNTEEPNRSDTFALLLVAVGCLVLVLTELIYVKDSFDLSASYRMNTVFKFYYQAWVLLMLAGAYGAFRGWRVLRQLFSPLVGNLVVSGVAVGLAGGLAYTWYAPQQAVASPSVQSLDGMAWLKLAHPSDYAGIEWLRTHVKGNPVILEAESSQSGYNPDYARVSTFTGLPTVMGWPDHEVQWRPNNPEIGPRGTDVITIYTTTNLSLARNLLRKYHVAYVFVGDTERAGGSAGSGPTGAALAKFGRFMHPVFSSGGTTIYTW